MAAPPLELFRAAVSARLGPGGRPGEAPFAAGAALAQAGLEGAESLALACALAARAASTARALAAAARARPGSPGLPAALRASRRELGGAIALLAGRGAPGPFALACRARDDLDAAAADAWAASWRAAAAARGEPPKKAP